MKVRTVLVVMALGVTGCGVGSTQTPLHPAITVSPDALAEYQQRLDDGWGVKEKAEIVKRAEALCNNLYLAADDGLIESIVIGEYERRYDKTVRELRDLAYEGFSDGPLENLARSHEYDDLRLTLLYACPEFARFISVLSPD